MLAELAPSPQPDSPLLDLLRPVAPWLVMVIAAAIVHWILFFASYQRYLAAIINERVRRRFDDRFFRRVQSLRLEAFDDPATYDAIARAYRWSGEDMAAMPLYQVQRLLTCTAGSVAILYALSQAHWGFVPALLLGGLLMARFSRAEALADLSLQDRLTPSERRREYWRRLLTERRSAAEVRLFGLADYFVGQWQTITARHIAEVAALRRRYAVLTGGAVAVICLLYGASLGALMLLISSGQITAGQLVALFTAVGHYLFFVHNSAMRVAEIEVVLHALRHAQEFEEARHFEVEEISTPTADAAQRPFAEIRFERVSFAYPGSEPTLRDLNFVLRAGERVALVGINGAGKTTLVKLLCGLYRPTSGRILVDGVDLTAIDAQQWRRNLAVVFQDFLRYEFTLAENIAVSGMSSISGGGSTVPSADAVARAARMSSADEIAASLPAGYETQLGREIEDGAELSLGQWQKVALARAYLRESALIVLDEPTSALDARAELEVYEHFAELSAGSTALLISHRLGSARLADRVMYLEDGHLAEEGTHDELIAADASYAELYRTQAEWYRDSAETA